MNFLSDELNKLETFLEYSILIEYDFKKWHQMIHSKRECTFCGRQSNGPHSNSNNPTTSNISRPITKKISPLMDINLNEIVQEFIESIKNNQHISVEHLGQIAKISIQFLSLEESAQISNNATMKILLNLAIIPLTYQTEIYTKQFRNYFPKFTQLATSDLTQFAEKLRSELCQINMRYLSRENQIVLMKIFEIYVLDKLTIEHMPSIYTFYLNAMLADPMQICDKLVNSMANMEQNKLKAFAIVKLIKAIICISSGEACAIQIKKKRTLDYRVICRKCRKPDDYLNEITENNYSLIKFEIQSSNKIIENNFDQIMNMANSTNSEIRQQFVVNLLCLASHFPSQIVRQNNFNIWKSLFLDTNLNVLNELAMNIGHILERIKVREVCDFKQKIVFFLYSLEGHLGSLCFFWHI